MVEVFKGFRARKVSYFFTDLSNEVLIMKNNFCLVRTVSWVLAKGFWRKFENEFFFVDTEAYIEEFFEDLVQVYGKTKWFERLKRVRKNLRTVWV